MSWKLGSETMVSHCGVLFGIVAAVLTLTSTLAKRTLFLDGTQTLFALSFVLLVLASERFSEALDFDDRRRYERAINWYNAGVVLFIWGLASLVLFFEYTVPGLILAGFSLYWLRDMVRSWMVKRRRKTAARPATA